MNTDPSLVTITKRAHKALLHDRRVLDTMAEASPELFVWATEDVRNMDEILADAFERHG